MNQYTLLFYLISTLIFSSCSSHMKHANAANLTNIHIVDQNGFSQTVGNTDRLKQYERRDFLSSQPYQKVLRTYGRDDKGNTQAILTSYYESGVVKQYLEIKNSRASGSYKEWFANGQIHLEANVVGGIADLDLSSQESWLFDGLGQVWNEEGQLVAKLNYENGALNGLSTYYHANGVIWKEVQYVKGCEEGAVVVYDNSGTLVQNVNYQGGVLDGEQVRYWPEGSVAFKEEYREGLLINGIYKDSKGSFISKIEKGYGFRAILSKTSVIELREYKHGKQEGKVFVYGSQGELLQLYHALNGLKNGEELIYYSQTDLHLGEKEALQASIPWNLGSVQGTVSTWYQNGQLESQKEVTNNYKQGLSTAWYRSGELMLVEEYQDDKLVRGEYYEKNNVFPASYVINGKGLATIYDLNGKLLRKVEYLDGIPAS